MTREELIICAKLCQCSYDDTDPRFIKVNEQSFSVIVMGEITYLVFRGTHNLKGWLHDFSAVPVLSKGGYLAHAGFVDAAHELWNPVCASLRGLPAPWIITGHSLGGALAVLYGEQIKVPVVTFGAPRVYSRMNGHLPEMEHYRVVNDDDLVPHVPEGLMWKHLCDPFLTLRDTDREVLNPEDHAISLYMDRLSK